MKYLLVLLLLLAGCTSPPMVDEVVGIYDIPTGELLKAYRNPTITTRSYDNSEDMDTFYVNGDPYWYPTSRVVRHRR